MKARVVQDHLILLRVEGSCKDIRREKMEERKAERVRTWVARRRRREGREPMTLETDETWGDWWMDLWQLKFETEVGTRDCAIGRSQWPKCRTCLVPNHARQVFGLFHQIDRRRDG